MTRGKYAIKLPLKWEHHDLEWGTQQTLNVEVHSRHVSYPKESKLRLAIKSY
jgi:hypothetical protein